MQRFSFRLATILGIVLLFLLGSQSSLHASQGLNVVEENSLLAGYFNVGKLYKITREKLDVIASGKDLETKKKIEEFIRKLPANNPLAQGFSFEKLKESFDKWHKDAIFIPQAGLWISVSPTKQIKIVIEADIKPEKFLELIKSIPPLADLKAQNDEKSIKFSIPQLDIPCEILPDRLIIGDVATTPTALGDSWQSFVEKTNNPGQALAMELDAREIIKIIAAAKNSTRAPEMACSANMRVLLGAVEMYNMDHSVLTNELNIDTLVKEKYLNKAPVCPNSGTYAARGKLSEDGVICCSIHNTVEDLKKHDGPAVSEDPYKNLPDPRLKNIIRVRLSSDDNAFMLVTSIDNEDVKSQFKTELSEGLKKLEAALKQLPPSEPQAEISKNFLSSLNVVDEGKWLGVSAKAGQQEQILVATAITGILAAIAIPNFAKARDEARKKACFANQRVILGAVEMYNMDNEKMMTTLSLDPLVNAGYLKTPPACIEGGEYKSEGDLSQDGKITCTVHGSVE